MGQPLGRTGNSKMAIPAGRDPSRNVPPLTGCRGCDATHPCLHGAAVVAEAVEDVVAAAADGMVLVARDARQVGVRTTSLNVRSGARPARKTETAGRPVVYAPAQQSLRRPWRTVGARSGRSWNVSSGGSRPQCTCTGRHEIVGSVSESRSNVHMHALVRALT